MTDGYTHLSQQFDGVSKNFTEKTAVLKVNKPPLNAKNGKTKDKIDQNGGITDKQVQKENKKTTEQQSEKPQKQPSATPSKPPLSEQKRAQTARSGKEEPTEKIGSKTYESSKLTSSQPSAQKTQTVTSSENKQSSSANMKSILTMSDDKDKEQQKDPSYHRPKSQSHLWSQHTMRTASQKAKKDEEKKHADEEKLKWHYAGVQKNAKSFDYFKTTRVSTCSYIEKVGDVLLAKPFYKAPQREQPEKLQKQSLGAGDYMIRPMTCTSSSKKPLEPYNPNAARNILKQKDVKMPHRNKSSFALNDGSDPRTMYKSLNKNIYGNFPKQNHTDNQGIAADIMKRAHYQNEK